MRFLFVFCTFLCLFKTGLGQGFSRLYNMAPPNAPFRISNSSGLIALNDGAVFWGNHISSYPSTLHTYLAKIDFGGNLQWKTTLNDSGELRTHAGNSSLLTLKSGNFLYLSWNLASYPSSISTMAQTVITWINSNGTILKAIAFNDSVQEKDLRQCVELSNGNIMCTGVKSATTLQMPSTNLAVYTNWLVLFDSTGNIIWEKSYAPFYHGYSEGSKPHMFRIHNMQDSLFVVGGYKIDSPRVRLWSCFAAYDQYGNPKWERFIHGQNGFLWGHENNSEAVPMGDSLWFFVTTLSDTLYPGPGGVPSFHGNLRGIYGYLNNQGDTLRVKNVQSRYPTNQYKQTDANQTEVLPDGSKLILFGLGIDGTHSQITAIQKLNTNDELQWERWYVYDSAQHFVQYNFLYGMSAAPNGSIYLAGTYRVRNNTAGDSTGTFAWLSRTDSFGCVVPGCHLGDSIFSTPTSLPVVQYPQALEVKLYPNPAQSQVTIEILGEDLPTGLLASVFNYSGQQVVPEQMLLDGKAQLDLTALPAGLYLCRLRSDKGVVTYQKLVKQ